MKLEHLTAKAVGNGHGLKYPYGTGVFTGWIILYAQVGQRLYISDRRDSTGM